MERFLNKITCGDCYELIKQLPDKSVDLIITDPPYEMDEHGGGGAFGNKNRPYQNEVDKLSNGITNEILEEISRVMKKINAYIFCNKNQLSQILCFFEGKKCNVDILVLHKTNPVPRINNKYLSDLEYCVFARDEGVEMYNTYETSSKLYSMATNKADKGLFEHPTIKPMKLIERFIKNSSNENDIVLDCFAGSGTTCVGAKELGRQYIGFEIDEKWCKIANDRINGVTASGQMSLILR